jgi:hypothetical protein
MFYFIITILISLLSGIVAKKLKIPAPLLVGGIIGVSIFNVLTSNATSTEFNKFFLQVISGSFIGSTLGKKEILNMRHIIFPAIVMIIGMMIVNIVVGTLIYLVSPMDYLTALLSTVPGGVTETTLMAESMGAVVSSVAMMQLVRSIGSLIFFPILIGFILKKEYSEPLEVKENQESQNKILRVSLTLLIGTVGGLCGYLFPSIPASQMVFSLIFVSVFNIFVFKCEIPIPYKKAAQVATGTFVGAKVTLDTLLSMSDLVLPLIMLMLGYLIFHTLLALFLSKFFKLDKGIMLFSCIPAGASDIALIASDYNCNSSYIAIFQIIRLIACIIVFPAMINLIATNFFL